MNKLLIIAGALASFIASPALAGSVTGEVKLSDPINGRTDKTEYSVKYDDNLSALFNYGVELQAKQVNDAGNLTSLVAAKLGTKVNVPYGVTLTPRVEFGRSFSAGNNFNFWGAEVNATRNVYGPVSARVGYRHREGFDNFNMVENRINAGLEYAINDRNSVGTQYYRTRGYTDSDAVGLFYRVSF